MAEKGLNIYKRKDGRWEARYIKLRTEQGKLQYGYLYASSYHEARENLQKLLQARGIEECQNKASSGTSTFEEASAAWLENPLVEFKEATYIRYRTLIKAYLLPTFHQRKINEIKYDSVQSLCKTLEQHGKKNGAGLSTKTISDILSVLRGILRYAQSQSIPIDPSIFNIRIRQVKKPLEIFSLSEQKILQEYLMKHLDALNLGILLCLFTGIRVGELCALSWNNISLNDNTLYICRTVQRLQKQIPEEKRTHIIMTSPKSHAANRTIPISNTLLGLLKQYPLKQTGYFLSGSSTEIVEPRRIQYRFHKVLKECGLERKNFHVLRHTFATRCIEANIDIKTLSELLGHSSVNITMNRYVHPTLKLKRDSMEKLSDFISVK